MPKRVTAAKPAIEFREPPKRRHEALTETLRVLAEHPGQWARVAEGVSADERQKWAVARRYVGAQGEFTIRQAKVGPGLVDIYVCYHDEAATR